MKTRVKICGITRIEDAFTCADEGVDAVGLVFYEKSPRNLAVIQATSICQKLPAFLTSVALFKDADANFVNQVIENTAIDILQFHGSESAEFCEQFNRPYIKALGMDTQAGNDLDAQAKRYQKSRGLLLDSHAPGEAGGTGKAFDWNDVPSDLAQPIILAGGLRVENVAQAIAIAKPYAVDISSGVEKSPGIKDAKQIKQFMQQVNSTCT